MPKWIYTQPILPRCHSPHFLSPTSFFSRSVAHPSKICKQKHLSKFQKQFKFPLQTQKESKQNNPPSAHPQNAQKQNQKDTTIHFIQPPQLEKLTSSTPPNSPQTTVKIPETAKRKYVSSQTPKSLPPNAEAFQTKRQRVSFQTQRRFPPSYLPTLLFPESTYKNTHQDSSVACFVPTGQLRGGRIVCRSHVQGARLLRRGALQEVPRQGRRLGRASRGITSQDADKRKDALCGWRRNRNPEGWQSG